MEPGSILAHYTIAEKIGQGGMGEVFRATDSNLGRDVALKMLPDMVARDPERLARFRREAQVLAALNHPGIAAVYGLESQDDRHALAMELVEGPELAERLQSGPLGIGEGLQVALQLAEAIEAAHEKGIIHRDLKPANIKLTPEGRVKVLDFGLAKALVEETAASGINPEMSPTLTANMTMGNVILGTAAYMSPEQARGTPVDKRADIWAFGVVVTEMLGGKRLFQGETVSDTLASVLKSAIDLDELPDDVPPAVRSLLRRCLQRDPRQRLRDIGDARLVLQDVLAGETGEAAAPTGTPGSPWPLRLAAGFALVAAAVAVFLFLRTGPVVELPLRKFEIPLVAGDSGAAMAFSPQVSPDGRYVVYTSRGQLWLRDLATTASRPLPSTDGANYPFWSPDGEWIGYGLSNSLMKIDRGGTRSLALANVPPQFAMGNAASAVWNADGSILYSTGNTGLLRAAAQGGEVVVHHQTSGDEVDYHAVCGLPDGRGWIVVVHTTEAYDRLALLTPDGAWRVVLRLPGDSLGAPTWSPTGHILFERAKVAEGIWAVAFSLAEMAVVGEPFLVAQQGLRPSVAADGTLVYATRAQVANLQMAWYDRTGEVTAVIADVKTNRPFPALSPDGSQIMLTATAEKGREIWVFDADSGNERRVTLDGMQWGVATWHPDGRHALVTNEADYHAYLVAIDGTEPRRALGPAILGDVSRDGRTFVFGRPDFSAGFDFDIAYRDFSAGEDADSLLVARKGSIEWYPRLSPDGKYLLYVSGESGRDEIYAVTFPDPTGRWQVSRNGGQWAEWRADGKEIFYTTMREMYAVTVTEGSGGLRLDRPVKLFDRPHVDWSANWADGYAVTPDGQRFVMLRPAPEVDVAPPALVVVQNWFAEFAGN